MRIIGGKYRGKKLKEFEINTTRPTTDRVKESIFNLIQFDIPNATVLDLFSGTGALGIEALSRGASEVVFVDANKQAVSVIKENLLNIEGNFKLYNCDAVSALENFKKEQKKFDLVFLDPPYATDLGVKAVEFLTQNHLMNEHGIIIFETAVDKDFKFDQNNYCVDVRKYGITNIFKIKKV